MRAVSSEVSHRNAESNRNAPKRAGYGPRTVRNPTTVFV